jgi:hypothetical protein
MFAPKKTLLPLVLFASFALSSAAHAVTFQTQQLSQSAMAYEETIHPVAFIAEGRFGNDSTSGTHELSNYYLNSTPLSTGQANWNNGNQQSFVLSYNPNAAAGQTLAFSIANQTLYMDPQGSFDQLYIKAQGTAKATMTVAYMSLKSGGDANFTTISPYAASNKAIGATNFDVLRLYNINSALSTGFTLKGSIQFSWTGSPGLNDMRFMFEGLSSVIVPEPGTVALFLSAGVTSAGALFRNRRRRKRA